MRVRTSLALLSASFVVLLAATGALMSLTFRIMGEQTSLAAHSDLIVRDTFELNILTYEYLMHREARMREQWKRKYRSLGNVLHDMERRPLSTEVAARMEEIDVEYRALGRSFSQLMEIFTRRASLTAGGGNTAEIEVSRDLEKRVTAQALMASQRIALEAFAASALIENSMSRTRRKANAIMLACVIGFGAFSSVFSFVLVRAIMRPVRDLTEGARIIGGGNLAHRVRIRTKNELGELAAAFNDMSERRQRGEEELRRLNEMKSRFLSTVSHEFRTPLTIIRSYGDIMAKKRMGGLTEDQREMLLAMVRHTDYLTSMVENILDLAKIDAGGMQPSMGTVDLNEPVQDSISRLSSLASGKHIALKVDIPATVPDVLADEEFLHPILDNLVSNAIKFTPEKGTITVRARTAEDRVQVDVEDTGIGIPPEHLSNVFDEFRRVPGKQELRTRGGGLGLAIVKRLVEEQGGSVWAKSEVGKGSTFSFTLAPASRQEA